jgi:CelD/BcsL family acetyltransferase involved in cellulose biosynthesis
VRGRIITVSDMTDVERAAWGDLARRAAQPNPLFEVDALVPAARHLRNGGAISLVVAEESGRFFGCFPVQRAARWFSLARPVLMTQVRRLQYDGTPLVDAERGHEAMVAMLRLLVERAGAEEPGLVVFDWIDDAGPAARHLRQAAHALGLRAYDYNRWTRPIIDRRPGGDYRALHSNKFLRNVERLRRRCEEQLGGPVALVDRSADRGAVAALVALEGAGQKGKTGVAVSVFADEVAWLDELCDRFRASSRLRLWGLEGGGTTLALLLGLVADRGLFLLVAAFNEALAQYTPGVQLHLDVIDQFESLEVDWIDSCTYEHNETMERLYPERRAMAAIVVATGGLADRAMLAAVAIGRRYAGRGSSVGRLLAARRGR